MARRGRASLEEGRRRGERGRSGGGEGGEGEEGGVEQHAVHQTIAPPLLSRWRDSVRDLPASLYAYVEESYVCIILYPLYTLYTPL